jgi:hypothetical protein
MISRSIKLPFKKKIVYSFMEDHPEAKPLCVSTCETPYMAGVIPVIPWKHFFRKDFLNILII